MEKIILASASPRRHQLLTWAEIDYEIVVKETDESFPPDMPVEEVPAFIAKHKALAVHSSLSSDRLIIAADTVVVLDEQIIGKPADRTAAISTLQKLSARKHRVITGVVLMKGDRLHAFSDITYVEFNPITDAQIIYYVDTYKPYDKAGAYAIQEWIGVIGIKSIEGDFYNVMGLPVSKVVRKLEAFK
jgi:septum formation protein